jgi:hypothetical protein
MPRLIKLVRGRNRVEFDKGKFDDWCVYLTRPGLPRYAPLDTEYFLRLKTIATRYGAAKMYNDFLLFYAPTTSRIDEEVLNSITHIADGYGKDAEEVDTWFSVIYGGMIAEENKEHAILKKRVKRLGMHQVLLEGVPPETAANFSRGRKWLELDRLMRQRGF